MKKIFQDVLKFLYERDVKYVIVGGMALKYYGSPRETCDLDLCVIEELTNVQAFLKAMEDLGTKYKNVDQYGAYPDKDLKDNNIDIMVSCAGMNFNEMFKNSVKIKIDDFYVYYINKEDLLKNKQALLREKDKKDIDFLIK